MAHLITKWTTAEELRGRRIRVTSPDMIASNATFIRVDTGEVIENVYEAYIHWKPGWIFTITLTLLILRGRDITQEAVVCENPILDIQASTYLPEPVGEITMDEEAAQAILNWPLRTMNEVRRQVGLPPLSMNDPEERGSEH